MTIDIDDAMKAMRQAESHASVLESKLDCMIYHG